VTPTVEQLLRRYAYKAGEFRLSSGQISHEYLDVKNVALHPTAGELLARHLVDLIGTDSQGPWWDGVAGVVAGGVPLAVRLGRLSERPALMVRLEPREHGRECRVDGLDNLPRLDGPTPVLLVEDVLTTGTAVLKAIDVLLDIDWIEVSRLVIVCDREQGGLERIKARHPGLRVEALTTISKVRSA
jgi:orotate phosphoribosyltransferase